MQRYDKNWYIMPYISEYPGPTLTYFTGLVRVLVGMIIPIFVWQLPKGHCYGSLLNVEDVCRYRHEWPLLCASTFDNGLADRKDSFKILNGSYPATSCTSMVNFCPIILEFMLLKRAIFAAIQPQFDDISSFVILKLRN